MRRLLLSLALIACLASPAMADASGLPSRPLVSQGVFVIRPLRNPTLAAACSTFFPAGGQVYDDEPTQWLVALALLGVTGYFAVAASNPTVRIASATGLGLSWLWSIGDAYVSAKAYNHQIMQQALP